jgi:large subunit ribosomal protein L31e
MAKDKKTKEPIMILEREYTVPLRRGWLKVAQYKRANKAVKTLKEFIARHMKIYDRDLRKVKMDISLSNEIRFRGMRKPLSKVRVKAMKFDDGIVKVELVNLPEHIKFAKIREEKKKSVVKEEKVKEGGKEKIEPEEKKEETTEAKEKEMASRDEGIELAKKQAKEEKHLSKDKKVMYHRTALKK